MGNEEDKTQYGTDLRLIPKTRTPQCMHYIAALYIIYLQFLPGK